MGEDEEGTLAALKAIRRELGDPKIKEHRGRIVKTTGDGLLIEFASVVDAVRCAVETQRAMAERNAAVPQARRIAFRMGINLGDIIIEDGDIFGDGVNIAARLEALSTAWSRRDEPNSHGRRAIAVVIHRRRGSLQDKVASSVAGAIEPKLRRAEIERASRKPSGSLDAYDLYLRALAQYYKLTADGTNAAVALAERALAIDPAYAPAAALLASCRRV